MDLEGKGRILADRGPAARRIRTGLRNQSRPMKLLADAIHGDLPGFCAPREGFRAMAAFSNLATSRSSARSSEPIDAGG